MLYHLTSFQILQGIWNPIGNSHTYVVAEEFTNYKDAKRAFEGL